ncbi:MAG: O-antigen ligase family protein, partial [Mariprofundales bacterium]|nr:O-antigen ligase family protein [Mariprofundales bacterium]
MSDISPDPHAPAKWEYAIWYLFLASWMQGMAILNIAGALLLVASARHLPYALRLAGQYRMLWLAVACYEGLRILTTIFAQFPAQAAVGLFDDLRSIMIGLAALAFLRSRQQVIFAAWASFTGVTILSWWSLAWQLWHHGLATNGDIIYGTFAHLNYSATYSMIAMLIMLLVLTRLPFRHSWPMLLGIVPIAVMQIPLSSRTVLLAAALGCGIYILIQRQWKTLMIATAMVLIMITGLSMTSTGLQQFGTTSSVEKQLEGHHGMPSIQIRLEIWGLLWQISKDHPFGIGPRNHGYISISPYRKWIAQHMAYTFSTVHQIDTTSAAFIHFDLNHSEGGHPVSYDPHSQYMESLVETGMLGVLSLLFLYVIPITLARRQGSQTDNEHALLQGTAMITIWILAWSGLTITIFHQAGLIFF